MTDEIEILKTPGNCFHLKKKIECLERFTKVNLSEIDVKKITRFNCFLRNQYVKLQLSRISIRIFKITTYSVL